MWSLICGKLAYAVRKKKSIFFKFGHQGVNFGVTQSVTQLTHVSRHH